MGALSKAAVKPQALAPAKAAGVCVRDTAVGLARLTQGGMVQQLPIRRLDGVIPATCPGPTRVQNLGQTKVKMEGFVDQKGLVGAQSTIDPGEPFVIVAACPG